MKKTKVFTVVLECVSHDENIEEWISYTKEESGENYTPEQVFENDLEDVNLGHPSWLKEQIEDALPNTVRLHAVRIKEVK